MARFNKQDSPQGPDQRMARSDDQDVEGHARIARKPGDDEATQGQGFRVARSDDEDVEGHAVRMARPDDEQIKDHRPV